MKTIRGYITDYEEALLIVHGIRLGLLPCTKSRLSISERKEIRSGCIYCFVESKSGIKRWTDGKIWSPSMIVGKFLMYKEVPQHLSKTGLKKYNSSSMGSSVSDGSKEEEDGKEEEDKRQNRSNNNNRPTHHKNNTDESLAVTLVSLNRNFYKSNDIFTFYKKTISVPFGDEIYHIISYFQPVFAKYSLSKIPFYINLSELINKNTNLLSDSYVGKMKEENCNFMEDVYFFTKPTQENTCACLNRKELEKIAVEVLVSNFGE